MPFTSSRCTFCSSWQFTQRCHDFVLFTRCGAFHIHRFPTTSGVLLSLAVHGLIVFIVIHDFTSFEQQLQSSVVSHGRYIQRSAPVSGSKRGCGGCFVRQDADPRLLFQGKILVGLICVYTIYIYTFTIYYCVGQSCTLTHTVHYVVTIQVWFLWLCVSLVLRGRVFYIYAYKGHIQCSHIRILGRFCPTLNPSRPPRVLSVACHSLVS